MRVAALCPKCSGPMSFDLALDTWNCKSCGAVFSHYHMREIQDGYRKAAQAIYGNSQGAGDNGTGALIAGIAPAGTPINPIPYAQPGGGAGGSLIEIQRSIFEQYYAQMFAVINAAGPFTPSPRPISGQYYAPEPAKPIEDGGIVMGEIIGWRCWKVRPSGALFSISVQSAMWTPGRPMASLEGPMASDAWMDNPDARGGVHAWKDKSAAMRYSSTAVATQDTMIIIGSIKLSGQVIEHERGYRAEFGEIASLDFVISDRPAAKCEDVLKKARAMYGMAGEGGYIETNEAHAKAMGATKDTIASWMKKYFI